MKKVHIVNPYNSVAMYRMSNPLIEGLKPLYEITVSQEVDLSADLNIHCPWHTMVEQERGESKHVIMYTHYNPPDIPALRDACERADLVVCMSFTGRKELVELGVDPKKLWVNYCAADGLKYKMRSIGVIGYPQPNGRKRESLLIDLAWQYDVSAFHFVLIGEGWDDTVNTLRSLGVQADTLHTNENFMQEIYQQIDCLLVTGYAEGGPLPVLEAMMVGTPILSPRLGYASDLLNEDCFYETPDDLMQRLDSLAERSIFTFKLAGIWTWKDYVKEYALLIGKMLGENVDLFPEHGESRYTQLLDIIDEIRPSNIVEIGTWNGNRALKMIQQAAKYRPIQGIFYQGFDLFETQTGEQFRREYSKHGCAVEVVRKRLEATGADIELVEGDTNHTLYENLLIDTGKSPLFYFVDGGHSEKTIENDAKFLFDALYFPQGAVAVFDDYYHSGNTDDIGCNRIIDNLDRNQFEVTHLPVKTTTDKGLVIGMVKVKRNDNLHIQVQTGTYATGSTLYAGGAFNYVSSMSLEDAPSPAANGC